MSDAVLIALLVGGLVGMILGALLVQPHRIEVHVEMRPELPVAECCDEPDPADDWKLGDPL